jgi:hypothetical protein
MDTVSHGQELEKCDDSNVKCFGRFWLFQLPFRLMMVGSLDSDMNLWLDY